MEKVRSFLHNLSFSLWILQKTFQRYRLLSISEADKNEIAGSVIYSVVCDEAELLRIAVSDRYRRNGFGRRLMQEFLGSLEGKADSVYLEVRSGNEAAIGLYKGTGFEVAGVRKNYYRSPDEDAILMKKMMNQI